MIGVFWSILVLIASSKLSAEAKNGPRSAGRYFFNAIATPSR